MFIETEDYEFAPLNHHTAALEIIREAEERIIRETGDPITLIAYRPTKSSDHRESK